MKYRQSVVIKNVTLQKANETFNDIKFLKYLIALQPVKIINWDGTYDGAEAHMKFWFLDGKILKLLMAKIGLRKTYFRSKILVLFCLLGYRNGSIPHCFKRKQCRNC